MFCITYLETIILSISDALIVNHPTDVCNNITVNAPNSKPKYKCVVLFNSNKMNAKSISAMMHWDLHDRLYTPECLFPVSLQKEEGKKNKVIAIEPSPRKQNAKIK